MPSGPLLMFYREPGKTPSRCATCTITRAPPRTAMAIWCFPPELIGTSGPGLFTAGRSILQCTAPARQTARSRFKRKKIPRCGLGEDLRPAGHRWNMRTGDHRLTSPLVHSGCDRGNGNQEPETSLRPRLPRFDLPYVKTANRPTVITRAAS